jgi:two-component system chemotaxis response regulator CheY
MSFNVLIVDDSDSMRAVIKKIIAISGFKMDRCFEAVNGRKALEVLSENWVDIIISDIKMLDCLNGDSLLREIPVIVVSTEGSEERVENVLKKGARGFIRKPFLPEEVRKILYDVIGVSHEGGYVDGKEGTDGCDF